jgi:hypothetical protein
VHPLLEVLRREAVSLAPALARSAYASGLAVTAPDGSTRPIPITATPVIAQGSEIKQSVHLSAQLSSAAVKMARCTLAGPERELLAGALSPLERRIAEETYAAASRFATTRVDYFIDRQSTQPIALEINATIPAMQGYSDIAAECFIRTVAARAGLDDAAIADLLKRNGSNALALHQALLDGFGLERGRAPARIGLLCRRNDAQITELHYLARRFRELGTEADVLFPDELSGENEVTARGKIYELIYRHLFVRRLEEIRAPYVVDLFREVPGRKAVVLNPPASQVEVKTTFALLSQASRDAQLAHGARLDDGELHAIRQAIPWTRLFRPGAASDREGQPIADLVRLVAGHPEGFVLKRAWDYGGKAVFIGRASADASFADRTRAAFGADLTWAELCERAAADRVGGGFIVQAIVDSAPQDHVLCSEAGAAPARLYVDFSAYGSVGLPRVPSWGGVCRGSPSPIVNIVGGGGVLPLITTDVADALLAAFSRPRASKKRPRAL